MASSLYHSLGIGAEALYASRQGVDTAGHNIANAHTEGFSRQRVNLEAREPTETRGIIMGNGVFVKNISRAHDKFLEKQIITGGQSQGRSEARLEALKAIEGIFSPELESGVGDEISKFFASVQDLANFPEELSVRTQLRENAQNLVNAFGRVDGGLRSAQTDLNNRVIGEVSHVNDMVAEIAKLNIAIGSLEGGMRQEANDLRDKQDLLVRELAKKIQVNYYQSDSGMMTVRGPGDTLLVDRGMAASIVTRVRADGSGMHDILFEPSSGVGIRNITELNDGGSLKSLVDIRDNVIPGLLDKNNQMAFSFANEVNDIHRQGFGLNTFKETMGREFFDGVQDVNTSARSLRIADVIMENVDAISVAATPFAPGDNVLANEVLRLNNKKVLNEGTANFMEFYSNYVGVLGLDIVRAEHFKDADNILMQDLNARREAVVGVSLDEEATNLIKWQSNFTASSKVITAVDEMLETVLQLKR